MAYGQNAVVGLARQNSWGTAASVSSLHNIPLLSEDVALDRPDLIAQNLTSRLDENLAVQGPSQVAGTINMELAPKALGIMLYSVLGAPTSVTSGSLGTHTFVPTTQDFDNYAAITPMTMYKKFANVATGDLHRNLVGDQLELMARNGELVQARVSFVGGTQAFQSSQGLTAENAELIPWSVSSVSVGGTAKTNIRELTVQVMNNLEPMYTLDGTSYPNRVKRTAKRQVRVSGTLFFDDQSEYVDFINGTTRRLVATFRGASAVQSGYFNSLIIDIPQLKYSAVKPVISGPEELEVAFEGRGEYNTGSGTTIQITLQNTWTAGY